MTPEGAGDRTGAPSSAPAYHVIAVVGPTASGKSDLAMTLAQRLDGEIVCCDSMQVYRGLDVGTGKPTSLDRSLVPHHMLDVVAPDGAFHAGMFAKQAQVAIADITARGRLPVVVGGTGLYFRALTQGLFEAPPPSLEIRARHKDEAQSHGIAALHGRLQQVDPTAAAKISPTDLVRTSRALEVWEQTGVPISDHWQRARPAKPIECFRVLFDFELSLLRLLIDRRVDAMMEGGFLEEVRGLREAGYGHTRPLAGLGYKELSRHLDANAGDLHEAVADIKKNTAAYARRQRTWFRSETIDLRLTEPPDIAFVEQQICVWRTQLGARRR